MAKYRVVQWGVGYTGSSSLRYIMNNAELELVGIKCFTEAKVSQTAQEICGHGGESTVVATRDTDAILALKPDCVLFMPRDLLSDPSVEGSPSEEWMPDLIAILESGANVVTPICTATHWRQLKNPEAFLDRVNSACAKGNATVTFTGFDPGFSTDYLPFTLTGVVGEVTQVRTWEILDYSDYPVAEPLTLLGFGVHPKDIPPGGMDSITATWGGAMYLLGESMSVTVDDLKVDAEIFLAPKTYTSPKGFTVPEGTIGAFWFKLIGICQGQERFVINHVTRMGWEMAPDWPMLGDDGGYRIEIDSYPPLRADLPMALPGGTGSAFADVMAMTAGRCVNSVEAVVTAEHGYKTYLDLFPVGGRYTVSA
jgi:2,4-diaminopentanoate dehydrogenase